MRRMFVYNSLGNIHISRTLSMREEVFTVKRMSAYRERKRESIFSMHTLISVRNQIYQYFMTSKFHCQRVIISSFIIHEIL